MLFCMKSKSSYSQRERQRHRILVGVQALETNLAASKDNPNTEYAIQDAGCKTI